MSDQRRYSDAEVAALLSRTAELSVGSDPKGSSLAEVERIAAEAGLDPTLVRQAAAELARGGRPTQKNSLWSKLFGRLKLRFETVIPGEIDESDHEELFDIVQDQLGLPGTLNRAGRAFSWSLASGPNGGRNLSVHISSRNGQTTLRIEERLGNLAGGIWGGVFGGVGGSLGPLAGVGMGVIGGGPLGVVIAVLGTLALTGTGTRAIYEAATNVREEQLGELFETLTDALSRMTHAPDEAQAASAPKAAEAESALSAARERQGLAAAPARDAVTAGDDVKIEQEEKAEHTAG